HALHKPQSDAIWQGQRFYLLAGRMQIAAAALRSACMPSRSILPRYLQWNGHLVECFVECGSRTVGCATLSKTRQMRPLCYLLVSLLVFNLIDDVLFAAPAPPSIVLTESDDEYIPILRETKQDWSSAHERGAKSVVSRVTGSPVSAPNVHSPFPDRIEPFLTRPCIYVFMSLQI